MQQIVGEHFEIDILHFYRRMKRSNQRHLEKEIKKLVEEIETCLETMKCKDRDKAEKDWKDIIIRQIKRPYDYFMRDISDICFLFSA